MGIALNDCCVVCKDRAKIVLVTYFPCNHSMCEACFDKQVVAKTCNVCVKCGVQVMNIRMQWENMFFVRDHGSWDDKIAIMQFTKRLLENDYLLDSIRANNPSRLYHSCSTRFSGVCVCNPVHCTSGHVVYRTDGETIDIMLEEGQYVYRHVNPKHDHALHNE